MFCKFVALLYNPLSGWQADEFGKLQCDYSARVRRRMDAGLPATFGDFVCRSCRLACDALTL